jgi:hypothetical protein
MPAVSLNSLTKSLRDLQVEKQFTLDLLDLSIPELKQVIDGVPKGAITEVFGTASSGKTTFLHAVLAASVQAGECCTLIDVHGTFDPIAANATGVDLRRLLWVRCCGKLEHALQATDMLVHGGGWGVVALDIADVPPAMLQKVPISYWHRFRLAVANTPTSFLVIEREPFVRSCASLAIEMTAAKPVRTGTHPTFKVLEAGDINVAPKKPVRQAGSFLARNPLSA